MLEGMGGRQPVEGMGIVGLRLCGGIEEGGVGGWAG
jgi:hypothetical protein